MGEPFIAEIRIFPYNFAPKNWADCNGQLIGIAQNTALFSLVGVTYGGNGTTTFGLPNLQDRVALGWGQGPGLSNYALGQTGGVSTQTLLTAQIPQHSHTVGAYNRVGNAANPNNAVPARVSGETPYVNAVPATPLGVSVGMAGNSSAHNNLMPYQNLRYCICMFGTYPTFS
jgi:microcystin-dependent protein